MLVNGTDKQEVSATDRGLMYGDGLFETIELYQGQPVYLKQHLGRLQYGCKRLGFLMPDAKLIADELKQVSAGKQEGILKIVLTRGTGGRGYRPPEEAKPTRIISFYPWPEIPADYYTQGIRLFSCQTDVSVSQALSGLKTLGRLDQVLAQAEFSEKEFAEGLMCDSTGNVIEGTKSNIFVVSNGELFTPALQHGGIQGIIRNRLIDLACQHQINVHEKIMDIDFVKQADEVFVCNSIIHIWPVCQYEDAVYKPGKMTKLLTQALEKDRVKDLINHV